MASTMRRCWRVVPSRLGPHLPLAHAPTLLTSAYLLQEMILRSGLLVADLHCSLKIFIVSDAHLSVTFSEIAR